MNNGNEEPDYDENETTDVMGWGVRLKVAPENFSDEVWLYDEPEPGEEPGWDGEDLALRFATREAAEACIARLKAGDATKVARLALKAGDLDEEQLGEWLARRRS